MSGRSAKAAEGPAGKQIGKDVKHIEDHHDEHSRRIAGDDKDFNRAYRKLTERMNNDGVPIS